MALIVAAARYAGLLALFAAIVLGVAIWRFPSDLLFKEQVQWAFDYLFNATAICCACALFVAFSVRYDLGLVGRPGRWLLRQFAADFDAAAGDFRDGEDVEDDRRLSAPLGRARARETARTAPLDS